MKLISLILAAILSCFCFFSCVQDTGAEKDSAADSGENASAVTDHLEYTDGTVLEVHLALLSEYFSADYSSENTDIDADILHLAAKFLYVQRPDTVTFNEDETAFTVSEQQLEKTVQLLFGDSVKLSDHTSYLDESLGDKYDSESATYSFLCERESWGESGTMLSMGDKMDISEDGYGFLAKVTVFDAQGEALNVTYKLSKVVYESYLYLRLDSVTVD